MGDAEDMIEAGYDPFIKPDGSEWEGGINPKYDGDNLKDFTSEQDLFFATFSEAKKWAKENIGKSITRSPDGIGFVPKIKRRY